MRARQQPDRRRLGTSAVEFAVVLPFLGFMVATAVDFARVYRHAQVVMSAARNAALYASDNPANATNTDAIAAVAKQEAVDLTAPPDVTSVTGTDADSNPYVRVTVACPFQTITRFPGVPSSFTVTRTVQMRVSALQPAGSP